MFSSMLTADHDAYITPHKYKNGPEQGYIVPDSCKHTAHRSAQAAPDIIYYLSKPAGEKFPIAILCTGSTSKNAVHSVICFHRYFLQEFIDLNCAVLTIEQWGVDGDAVDEELFMQHYTRTQRLNDHCDIIDHIKRCPPEGWDGTIVLLGVSEGGPLVTALTERYPEIVRATINWCGAGDWGWQEELWAFIEGIRHDGYWWNRVAIKFFLWLEGFPSDRSDYDIIMDDIRYSGSVENTLLGMTYKYHSDALAWNKAQHCDIKTPFLVVAGAQDTIIESCDSFVQSAQEAGAPITYIRVDDMDHYIRKRPDIIDQSFAWLKQLL